MKIHINCIPLLGFICFSTLLFAQPEKYKLDVYWVEFLDKDNTPYSIFHPEDYLSPRALERRRRYNIPIDETDLPIDPVYLRKIKDLDLKILNTSNWFNAISVYIPHKDKNKAEQIRQLPFVKNIDYLGKFRPVKPPKLSKRKANPSTYEEEKISNYFGYASNQTRMLNGHLIHKFGYKGQDMHVAIFDGGFTHVHRMPAFDSLRAQDRILGTHDFVQGDEFVYESSTHGTNVLSTMASEMPYLLVGTSPQASYYLFKTEDVKGEYRIEEFNWVVAAEKADSLGVDVINSSLGYTNFNDTTMSYKYEQLDGKTALCTRGANIAHSKGMIIVNSAGNEGGGKWHYIGAPADAEGVISVAATQKDGERAYFSSYGPTADQRLKPNLAARGQSTAVASKYDYKASSSSGTSFSSPVLAGMITSFWGAFPELDNKQIQDVLEKSASQATEPDTSLGYGIPNFYSAYIMSKDGVILIDTKGEIYSTKTIVNNDFSLLVEAQSLSIVNLKVYNSLHELLHKENELELNMEVHDFQIPNLKEYPRGIYWLNIQVNERQYWMKLVKTP
ncbi:MAG: S8 family serine peptidase [Saprospiraceae bacterium]|nr:S8 family serine peptidase [Saprospiraceae bacterium]